MMAELLRRLHRSHKSWMLRSVLLPPLASGMMWSYSNLCWLPHSTHLPSSRRQTYVFTLEGIVSRRGRVPVLEITALLGAARPSRRSLTTKMMDIKMSHKNETVTSPQPKAPAGEPNVANHTTRETKKTASEIRKIE